MCGIVGVYNTPDPFTEIFESLYMLQHRGGPEGTGVLFSNSREFISPAPHRTLGLVEQCANEWPGETPAQVHLAIGHTRYGTAGAHSNKENVQPLLRRTRFGHLAIGHNGDTPGFEKKQRTIQQAGAMLTTTSDTEVLLHDIGQQEPDNLCGALLDSLGEYRGAFSLILTTPSELIGCRDPWGYRPLSIGRLGDGFILASETCVFDVLGAEYVRDVEPGELVWIDSQGLQSYWISSKNEYPRQQCVFEQIYLARPDSKVFGKHVDKFRKELGAELAREYGHPSHNDQLLDPDEMVIFGVPDSAVFIAEGYTEELGNSRKDVLIRHHYSGRTFMLPGQKNRDNGVRLKFNPLRHHIEDKWCVILDDSLVRGTTMRRIVRMVRKNGAAGVTVLIASPQILHPCKYGIDMKTYKELVAAENEGDVEKIQKFIEADSLYYLSIEGLKRVIGDHENFCLACFNGEYAL
jgi:amidophosphoribosyltransferase